MSASDTVQVQLDAWRGFLESYRRLVDVLAAELEGETGLPLDWYEVLLYLDRADGHRLRMHQLAESLLLSRSAATRFVDRMEASGLVERKMCAADRRGTFVAMTQAGATAFRRAAPVHRRGIEVHFTGLLTDDETVTLSRSFERILGALQPVS